MKSGNIDKIKWLSKFQVSNIFFRFSKTKTWSSPKLQHFFSHLLTPKNKIAWHTFKYGPKIIQIRLALFIFSFLSVRKETNTHVRPCTSMYVHVHPCTSHVRPCTSMYVHVRPCTLLIQRQDLCFP